MPLPTEREFLLFYGPGGAMGIGFLGGRWDLFFARQREKKIGVFLLFLGGVFVLLGVFFCFSRAARISFLTFFSRGAVSKTGNSRSDSRSSTTRAADWRSWLVRACARSLGLARRNLRNLKKFNFQNACVLHWRNQAACVVIKPGSSWIFPAWCTPYTVGG